MTERTSALTLKVGEIDDWAVGFSPRLNEGETLDGDPEVTIHEKSGDEAVYPGITATQVARNTEAMTDDDGVVHGVDEAVEFRITAAGDAVAGSYTLRVECGTTTGRSPVETFTILLSGPPEA